MVTVRLALRFGYIEPKSALNLLVRGIVVIFDRDAIAATATTHLFKMSTRSAEITKPLRLGRFAIIAGLVATIALIAILSLGVGRSMFGFAPRLVPGRIELRARHPGGSSTFAFRKQIAMTGDGSGIVFVMETDEGEDVLATQSLDSETPVIGEAGDSIVDERSDKTKNIEARATKALAAKSIELRYAAGHIVYAKPDGSLWAAPFDDNSNRLTAEPVQIGTNVAVTSTGIAQFAVSKNGNVAYLPAGPRSLVMVTLDGKLHNVTDEHHLYSNPRFSPDGKRISVDITDEAGQEVWTIPVNGGKLERATFEGDAHDAVWTPDGNFLTWTSFRLGSLGIYRSRPGSRAKPDSILTAPSLAYSGEWLRGGSGIVTTVTNLAGSSRFDIALLENEGSGPIVPVVTDRFETRFPVVAANGRWLAYTSDQSGHDDVYIRAWNRPGNSMRLSALGSTEPVWSPDGKELYFRSSDGQELIDVSFAISPDQIVVLERRALFPIGDMLPGLTHANFDISPN